MPDLDLYNLKRGFERTNELLDLSRASAGISFLRHARRVFLPLPIVDRPEEPPGELFPELSPRPVPALAGKRIGVIASGGGGGCVSMVGVARAFEEAGIRPASYSASSGGTIWGAMWASGMSAQEMADFSLSWRPEDYLDGLPDHVNRLQHGPRPCRVFRNQSHARSFDWRAGANRGVAVARRVVL
jgi:NTE family protein